MKYLKHSIATCFALCVGSGAAYAEGLYYGLGVGYTDAESAPNAITSNTSGAGFGTLGLTIGKRWERPEIFWGAEANLNLGLGADFDDDVTGLSCELNANGPYYCSHKATLRLRGMVGTSLANNYEVFGTLGLAAMTGDGATSPTTQDRGVNTGLTAGVGIQRQFGTNTHRIELIYDNLTSTSTQPGDQYSPDYKAVSLNYTLIFGK